MCGDGNAADRIGQPFGTLIAFMSMNAKQGRWTMLNYSLGMLSAMAVIVLINICYI
jgi:hypothetical protein